MEFKVGDHIVHWSYGLGSVIAIEEKAMDGETRQYYCVEAGLLNLWVPLDEVRDSPIRPLAERNEFPSLFEILRGSAEPLPEHQFIRKKLLRERLQKHTIAETCKVIRDLRALSRQGPLNQNDAAVLQRVEAGLIDEWVISCDVDRNDALQTLEDLLAEQNPPPAE